MRREATKAGGCGGCATGWQQTGIVRADDNLVGRVTTRVRSGNLLIGARGNFTTEVPIANVGAPDHLVKHITGTGSVTVQERVGTQGAAGIWRCTAADCR
jgi:hypothetical protein